MQRIDQSPEQIDCNHYDLGICIGTITNIAISIVTSAIIAILEYCNHY